MKTTIEFSTTNLTELQAQLTAWRRKQPGRPRLPEAVWMAAAELARSLGASHVSRALQLDYYKLNRLAARAGYCPALPAPATFVELALGPHGLEGSNGYRAEAGNGTTDKLTLHLGRDVSAVVALAEAFWRGGR